MRSIDRLIILRWLGTLALGYYSLSVMALGFMLYLPDSIAYVLYPRLLRDFRHHDRRPEAIRGQVERALRTLAVLVPALCGLAYLVAREAIMLVLPNFMPGLTSVRVLCFGAGGLTLANLSSIVLMTVGRQSLLVPMAVGVTALGAALDYVAVRAGLGINGVARMTLVTYLLNGGLLLWLACDGLRVPGAERVRLLGRALAPLLIAFVIAYGLDKALLASPATPRVLSLLRLLGAVGLFVVLYGAAVAPLVRGLGLRQVVSEFNLMMPREGRRTGPAAEP
jgi:O-antigen/teichoic acid export membrane protein